MTGPSSLGRKSSLKTAAFCTAGLLLAGAGATFATTVITTDNGTWTAYPGQSTVYHTTVQQPINVDGSSNFKFNSKAVIPIKFGLAQGQGPFVFESVFSNNPLDTSDDYSFLSWTSSLPLTFRNLTQLSALYDFTDGDCAGGSLRWTVRLNDNGTNRNLDIHYQPGAGGISQQTCASGTSGQNLIGSTDAIYVTQQFNGGYTFPSSYNNTYADALSELGDLPVVAVTLIVDSGWGANGDQVVDLSSATIATDVGAPGGGGYTETFTPQTATSLAATCDLPQATIKVTKLAGNATGQVNEPETVQPSDSNNHFRVVDCKYMYNLATSSLPGTGQYQVEVLIDGTAATGAATFDLR